MPARSAVYPDLVPRDTAHTCQLGLISILLPFTAKAYILKGRKALDNLL